MSNISSFSNTNFYTSPTSSNCATSSSTRSTSSSESTESTDSIDSSSAYSLSDSLSTLISSLSTSASNSASNSSLNDLYSSSVTMSYGNSLTPTEFQYMQNMNNSTDDMYSTQEYQNTSSEISALLSDGTNNVSSSNTASTLISTLLR